MFSRRIFIALATVLVMGSSAFAGGNGGTKKDATISVRNDTPDPIAVFVDPDQAKINALPAVPTKAQIEAAGGKVVEKGATASFKVKAGTYLLAAGDDPKLPAVANVTIGKGQTKRYAFTPAGALVAF